MKMLSLDGGGYKGLATASFLAELERHYGTSCHEQFQFFCGTSTGSIIALALAAGMSAQDIVDLYVKMGPKVFWNPLGAVSRFGRFVRGFILPRYGNRQLRRHLQDALGTTTLAELESNGKRVLIPAYCVSSGSPRVFKTDHAADLSAHGAYKAWEIALASSSAPTFFPLVQITGPTGVKEIFCDGGVYANSPALLGYVEAVEKLGVEPRDLNILSVSPPRPYSQTDGPSRPFRWRGLVGWAYAGIPELFIDSGVDLVHQTLKRIARQSGCNYVPIRLEGHTRLALDNASSGACESLKRIGNQEATTEETREAVSPFFS